jgi:hypothetical protein
VTYLFHHDTPSVADDGDELSIQVALRKALAKIAPGVRLIAIPNGAQRTVWAAMKAKQEGMASGFPDCEILWNGGHAYVELKTRTGKLSDAQHLWLNWLTQNGHSCGVFRSVATCLTWLHDLGAPVARVTA